MESWGTGWSVHKLHIIVQFHSLAVKENRKRNRQKVWAGISIDVIGLSRLRNFAWRMKQIQLPKSGYFKQKGTKENVNIRVSWKFKNSTWRSLGVQCFVRISEQTAIISLYVTNWLAFITVVERVYCVVRTDSLCKADYVSSLNG